MQVNPIIELQDDFPYILDYNIVPITINYTDDTLNANSVLNLYFIALPLNVLDKDGNTVYGNLYFNLYKETDTFSYNKYKESIRTYLEEYTKLCLSNDTTATLNVSTLLNGNDMFVSYNIYKVISEINNSENKDKSIIENTDGDTDGDTIVDSNIYIKEDDIISKIEDLTYDELYNKDIQHWININKARIANIRSEGQYTQSQLDAFTSTFFYIIKSYINDKDTSTDTITGKIYDSLISYYINSKTDSAVSLIDLILSSSYSYTPSSTITSSCSCSSSTSSSSVDNSCVSKYQNAMDTWLIQMMQDITSFYNKYFYIEYTDETTGEICYKPDTDLIDALILLIDEFEAAGYDLSFSTDTSKFNVCNCSSEVDRRTSNVSNCNYSVLDNFKTLLLYIKENNVEGNENKIKLYGKAFATILPKMYF